MEAEHFLKEYQFKLENNLAENHQNQIKHSKEKGEEDGKRNLPSVDDNFITPIEHEIRNKYQAEIEALYQKGRQVLDDLHEKNYKPVAQELNELNEGKIQEQLNETETEKNRKLDELNTNHLDLVK